ncbi:hypothetical protein BOX15_Mlig001851g1 [Macrostomum lignano]|uniref:Uncharacterized protein n=1 Tax=Macrostomum lignano TaxID=282301 RepID=A0A267EP70_9PLAT|nr:hypothetical protein BOX15_Mlig026410g1 [Macrostomum lignano]PAA72368.1 hypothetical protein BOX15_Mlig001851g1 [Macrostomum lignano]
MASTNTNDRAAMDEFLSSARSGRRFAIVGPGGSNGFGSNSAIVVESGSRNSDGSGCAGGGSGGPVFFKEVSSRMANLSSATSQRRQSKT